LKEIEEELEWMAQRLDDLMNQQEEAFIENLERKRKKKMFRHTKR
jgi:hypothetical protein